MSNWELTGNWSKILQYEHKAICWNHENWKVKLKFQQILIKIQLTSISYNCTSEKFVLSLREKHGLKVSKNKVFKQIFVAKNDEDWRAHFSDGGGSKHLWNIGKLLPDYMAQQPRRQPSSYSLPWELEISL
jgi:hypothetical protein